MIHKNSFIYAFILVIFSIFQINYSSADTIKFGVAGPHSGALSDYGIPALRAAQISVTKINSEGGILGKTIELINKNDYCNPTVAADVASELIDLGANLVLGHICSGATKSALEVYKSVNIVVMSPTSTLPELTQSGDYPNFFRTIPPDNDQAQVQAYYAVNILEKYKFAIVHDNTAYGSGIAENSKAYLLADNRASVDLYKSITPGLSDYSSIVQEINESKADCLIYGGFTPEASKILSQLRQLNEDIVFISDDAVKDNSFIDQAGENAEGAYVSGPKDPSNNIMYKQALIEYEETYGGAPGPYFAEAYAGCLALFNAIKSAGSIDNFNAILLSLRNDLVNTPLGEIRFDSKGDVIGATHSIYQVINGSFVEVYPPNTNHLNPGIPILLLMD